MTWKGANAKPSLTPDSTPLAYAARVDSSPPLDDRNARLGRGARGGGGGGARVGAPPVCGPPGAPPPPAPPPAPPRGGGGGGGERVRAPDVSCPRRAPTLRRRPPASLLTQPRLRPPPDLLNSSVDIAADARGMRPRISGRPPGGGAGQGEAEKCRGLVPASNARRTAPQLRCATSSLPPALSPAPLFQPPPPHLGTAASRRPPPRSRGSWVSAAGGRRR
jgi:hypothetical protein